MLDVERFLRWASAHHAQIVLIPSCGYRLPRRIRPRLIRARGDSLLAQLADVPVLFVGHIPKLDRVLGIEVFSLERIRMKKPVANDQRSLGRSEPELMQH